MTPEQFETLIGTLQGLSGVLGVLAGAAVTVGLGLMTKRVDFTNDYLKHIIAKRLKAYESVESILAVFLMEARTDGGETVHSFMLANFAMPHTNEKILLVNLLARLNVAFSQNKHWLSDDLTEKIQAFLYLCTDIDGPHLNISRMQGSTVYEYCLEKALENKAAISQSLDAIMNQFYIDFENIHEVTGFLRRNQRKVHIWTRLAQTMQRLRTR